MTQHDLDLTITKISNRNRGAGGSWVQGKINDEYVSTRWSSLSRRTRIVRTEPKQDFEALGPTPGRPQSDVQLRPWLGCAGGQYGGPGDSRLSLRGIVGLGLWSISRNAARTRVVDRWFDRPDDGSQPRTQIWSYEDEEGRSKDWWQVLRERFGQPMRDSIDAEKPRGGWDATNLATARRL